jgi:transposase-like protein
VQYKSPTQEVEDFPGRAHYKRGKRKHQGWQNGYREGKVTTAEGFLELALPRVRETEEPFHSRLSPLLKKGSDMLGRLVREMYVRGLSTRDVEGMFIQDRHLKPLGHPSNQTKYRNKIPRRSNKIQVSVIM